MDIDLSGLPPGIDLCLLQEYRIESFNAMYCHLDSDHDSTSPLKSLLPNKTKTSKVSDTDRIAQSFLHLKWNEHYGMSFNDVKHLPFDEWYSLLKELEAYYEQKHDNPIITAIDRLTERITQLMCVAFNLSVQEKET